MAALRKRKRSGNEDEQQHDLNAKKSKPANNMSGARKPRARTSTPTTQPENLIMKLTAELRNKIYHLALETDGGVEVREWKKPKYKGRNWREPKPLQVSRQIRSEAAPMYYADNIFFIRLSTRDIKQACTWIRKKQDLCAFDPAEGRPFAFSLFFMSGQWKGLKSWFPRAKVMYDTDVGQGGKYDSNTYRTFQRGGGKIQAMVSFQQKSSLEVKLQEVALLGRKAKRKGLGYEELKVDFEEWASSVMSSSGLRKVTFEDADVDEDDEA